MEADETFPARGQDPVMLLARQDLDPLSLDELHARIAALEAEIERTKSKIGKAVNHRASAESLFKR